MFKYVVEYYQGNRIVKQVEIWAAHPEEAEWKASRIHGNPYPSDDNARWITLGKIPIGVE